MSRASNPRRGNPQSGTALLAVLWLTTALSMIAFSIADTVRAEIERSAVQQESLRAYYLARGAVEQTLFRLRDAPNQGIPLDQFLRASRRGYVRFATGEAIVEIVSEQGKWNVRQLTPALTERLLAAMGEEAENRARVSFALSGLLGAGPRPNVSPVGFSGQNPGPQSTFLPPLASLENVEELMLVPGVHSEIMYGRFARRPDGVLSHVGGFLDCLSTLAEPGTALDAYDVHPTLLVALGMNPLKANALAEARTMPGPEVIAALQPFLGPDPSGIALSAGLVGPAFQIRATARLRLPTGALSDTRRSVSLLVNVVPPPPQFFWREAFSYLRWYDQAYSDFAARPAAWLPVSIVPDSPTVPVAGVTP